MTTNRELAVGYLEWLKAHDRKQLTVYQYGGKLESLCEALGSCRAQDATLQQLEAWVGRPRRARTVGAAATRSRDVTLLRGFYKWMLSHGHIYKDVTADMQAPTVRNTNPKAIDSEVWAKVWASELTNEERVYLGLGFFCGLRRAEICALEPRHLNVELGQLVGFPRKGDRNEKTTGVVPVASCAQLFAERQPDLLCSADDFLNPLFSLYEARRDSRWLLPWGEQVMAWRRTSARPGPPEGMTNPDQLNKRTMRLLVRCGLPMGSFTPHALRHSFVTYLLRAGIPLEVVSRLANHSSVEITMRYVRTATDPLADFLSTGRLGGSRW